MPLSFERRITFGNIVEMVSILILVVIGWVKIENHAQHTAEKLNELSDEVSQLKVQFVRADLHDYQIKVVNEKLEEIRVDVKTIRRRGD